jgi:hypothetical protein
MSRFHSVIEGSAAASGAYIGYLQAASGSGAKLRRLTLGFTSNATTPASAQIEVRAYRGTAALTAGTSLASSKLDPNSPAAACTLFSAGSGGTLETAVSWSCTLNTQSAADFPWEQLEEWILPSGAANSLVFVNETTLPASPTTTINLAVEWEE